MINNYISNLSPCSDKTIRVKLWGKQARTFSYPSTYNLEQQDPIVVLFAGCLPKEFNGLLLHLLSNILLYTSDNYGSHPHRSSIFKWWCRLPLVLRSKY
jgi:hypothetical protein